MKKRLSKISLMLFALLAITSSMYAEGAYELTQLWKHTTGVPSAGWGSYVRDAVGKDGKIYIQTPSTSILAIWDESGNTGKTIASANGVGVGLDDAGNIIVSASGYAAGQQAFVIIDKDDESIKKTITLPTALARMDHIGGARGDLMSSEGGELYICVNGEAKIYKIAIKDGEYQGISSISSTSTADWITVAYPVAGDDSKIISHKRGDYAIYINDGEGNDVKKSYSEIKTTASSTMFQLKGVNYIVYNIGTVYGDGFSIANMETGEVVATHAAETAANKDNNPSYANQITCEVVGDKVNIYAYTPGNMIAMYEYAFVENPVAKADRAIFAYDLTAKTGDSDYKLDYMLNADAVSAEIIVKDAEGNQVGAAIAGGTAKGANSVTVAKADYPGADLSWEVTATGTAIAAYNKISGTGSDYKFYAPYGLSVDNNPESDNFGNVYVTNSGNEDNGAYSMCGLAAFDASLARYSFNGTNIFNGGITARNGSTQYDFRKVEVMDDGSIVIASDVKNYSQLYRTTFANIGDEWTSMFDGTQDTETGIITNASGEQISSPIAAFTIDGKGDDQKIWALNGYSTSFTGISRYDIGQNKTIASVDKTYAKPEGHIISVSSSMLADGLGGYWTTQYRASDNSIEPSVAHHNADGVCDYARYATDADLPNSCQFGGIAINEEDNLMALADASGTIAIYSLSYNAAGAPTLTYVTKFAAGIGNQINEIAFDYAGNIHAVSSSGEWYAAYAGKTDDNTSTVKCSSKQLLNNTVLYVDEDVTINAESAKFETSTVFAEDATLTVSGSGKANIGDKTATYKFSTLRLVDAAEFNAEGAEDLTINKLEVIKTFAYDGDNATKEWFNLGLPFEVEAGQGKVLKLVGDEYVEAVQGVDYATYDYDGLSRAANGKGDNWVMYTDNSGVLGELIQFAAAGEHTYKFVATENDAAMALTDGREGNRDFSVAPVSDDDNGWNLIPAGKTYTTDYAIEGVAVSQEFKQNGSFIPGAMTGLKPGTVFAAKLTKAIADNTPNSNETSDAAVETYTFELVDADAKVIDRVYLFDGSNKAQYRVAKMGALAANKAKMSIQAAGKEYCAYSTLASEANKSYTVSVANVAEGSSLVMTAKGSQAAAVNGVNAMVDAPVAIENGNITITIGSQTTSVADVVKAVKVYAANGAIVIEGAGAYVVTNMSGVAVASGVAEGYSTIDAAAGVYVVNVEGEYTKVIVK